MEKLTVLVSAEGNDTVGAATAGTVGLSAGNRVCGKVARLRAAVSVGRYKLPLWPQADPSAAHTTTAAAATLPQRFVA